MTRGIALVTGAGRGVGRATAERLARGGYVVVAGVRDLDRAREEYGDPPGIHLVQLDVTVPAHIAGAVEIATDFAGGGAIDVLVNNAGHAMMAPQESGDLDVARAMFETNVWGPMNLSKAFAPVLAANGGGAIVNVLSAVSWMSIKDVATYAMSKSAAWSLTNALRLELARQGTLVVAVHPAFIDTDMAAGVDMPKTSPQQVVERTLDGVAAGLPEVLADDTSAFVKNSLPKHIETFYPKVAGPRP